MLLQKSAENLLACELLIKSGHFTVSVHHAYYSCFQRVAHLLWVVWQWEPSADKSDLGNSHNKVITIFYEKMANSGQRLKAFDVQQALQALKRHRVKADYARQGLFTEPQSRRVMQEALRLNDLLASLFPTQLN